MNDSRTFDTVSWKLDEVVRKLVSVAAIVVLPVATSLVIKTVTMMILMAAMVLMVPESKLAPV